MAAHRFYESPAWALKDKPSVAMHLEVIKEGQHVETIPLSERPYFVIGRQEDTCHIVPENPSLSRQHAVLQYRQEDDGRLYVYDLKSTHGTFWNKKQITPFRFVPLRIGDQLRFGVSSRVMVVGSNDPRVSELEEAREVEREKYLKRQGEKLQREREQAMRKEAKGQKRVERRHWKKLERHMKKQSDEDEDENENDDYDDDESHVRRVRVEDECMDNSGLFDENDDFYDRTKRKRQRVSANDVKEDSGKKQRKVETMDSLQEKQVNITTRLVELRKTLDQLPQTQNQIKETKRKNKKGEEDDDSLEQFMQGINSTKTVIDRSSIESQIAKLEEERETLHQLIEIAKPAIEDLWTSQQKNKFSEVDLLVPEMFIRTKRQEGTEKLNEQLR